MAIIDTEREVIVVRIVYEGPPKSGKTTSIQTLGKLCGRMTDRFSQRLPQGETLSFDWMEYIGGFFRGYSISCQIISVPGPVPVEIYRHFLLGTADAVVLIVDATDDPKKLLDYFEHLQKELVTPVGEVPIKLVIQANKQDQPNALSAEELRKLLRVETKIVEATATSGKGVWEAFVLAVRLATERARALLAKGQLKYGHPEITRGEELLAILQKNLDLTKENLASDPRKPSLPPFPDPETPPQWIWPPFSGRHLLNAVHQHSLRPSLQGDLWVVKANQQWRGFSKLQWRYSEIEQARLVLRQHIKMHLQGSPWLSEQRGVIIAEKGHHWHLWQIVQQFPTLASSLAKTWQTRSPPEIALETLRCAVFYSDFLHQSVRYSLKFNLVLENLARGANDELIYLGEIDQDFESPSLTTQEMAKAIQQTFSKPLSKLLQSSQIERTTVINELSKMDGFEQPYVLDALLNLLSELT